MNTIPIPAEREREGKHGEVYIRVHVCVRLSRPNDKGTKAEQILAAE